MGKTSAALLLRDKLKASYFNLTDLALRDNLTLGKDEKRDSIIIDEAKMKKKLVTIIKKTYSDIIIDGHYAANVVPRKLVTFAFVLRRDPVELKELMKKSGFSEAKQNENLAAEILDVCLVDALGAGLVEKICEIDVTGKSPEQVVKAIIKTMADPERCRFGSIDWLGKLEKEGLLEEYLKM